MSALSVLGVAICWLQVWIQHLFGEAASSKQIGDRQLLHGTVNFSDLAKHPQSDDKEERAGD